MATDRRTRFREYMRRLDPTGDPAQAVVSKFYVRPPNAVSRRIATRIELLPASSHLLVGGIGSGKTTELIVIERDLADVDADNLLPIRIDVPSCHRIDKLKPGVLVALAAAEARTELSREREQGLTVEAQVVEQARQRNGLSSQSAPSQEVSSPEGRTALRRPAGFHCRDRAGSKAPLGALDHRGSRDSCPLYTPSDHRALDSGAGCHMSALGVAELADRTLLEPGGWSVAVVEEARIAATTRMLEEELTFWIEEEGAGSVRVFSERHAAPALVEELARMTPEDVALLPLSADVIVPVSRVLDYERSRLSGRPRGVIITSEAGLQLLAAEAPSF